MTDKSGANNHKAEWVLVPRVATWAMIDAEIDRLKRAESFTKSGAGSSSTSSDLAAEGVSE